MDVCGDEPTKAMTPLPLRVAFRTDASIAMGTGHVMRCLTLADALNEMGAECQFLCRPHVGHLLPLIAERGHRVKALQELPQADFSPATADPAHAAWLGTSWYQDALDCRRALDGVVDWLVLDHYALDRRWEQALRPLCRRLMVMDDLADRPHDCDLLLDPSLGRVPADYARWLPEGTVTLLGPQFALLRPEFALLRTESLTRRQVPELRQLLITMGGVDKDNASGLVLTALSACTLPPNLEITVVMGPHAPWLTEVCQQAATMSCPTRVLVGVANMARLMADSDLAIGAAGSTAWERCCLGLPSIQLVLAKNQELIAAALSNYGASITMRPETIKTQMMRLLSQRKLSELLSRLSQSARVIADGTGTQKVIHGLMR